MNDRFEPRQLGANGAGFGRPGSDEDPLLELARIVSGRGPQPEAHRRSPLPAIDATNEADLVRDLEAELLSDLQASFAAQRKVPAEPEAPRSAPPLESASGRAAGGEAGEPAFGFLSLRRGAVYEPDVESEPPAASGAAEPPAEAVAPDPFEALRFDYPAAAEAPSDEAAPGPEGGPNAPPLAAGDDDFDQPLWSAETGFAPAGYEATEDQLRSLEAPASRRGWRSRGGLTLVAGAFTVVLLGGVALIALRGEDATAGAPAVITADRSPVRIAAVDPAPDPADANKLIFDRVGASGAEVETVLAPAEDPVADVAGLGPGETGIPRVALRGTPGDDAIGGIVAADPAAPAGGETVAPGTGPRRVRTVTVRPDGTIVENGAAPAGETPIPAAIAAPGVPDALALGATPAAPAAVEAAAEVAAAPAARPERPIIVAALPPAADAQTVAGAGAPAATATLRPGVTATPPSPETTAATRPSPARSPAATRAPISLMPDVGRQAAPAATVRTAAVAPAAETAPTAPVAGGGFVVQVTSQRSEDAALSAFRALQARVPNLLAGREANIQRANLGDRGTFYRARVAPATSREDAVRLCQSLKAAGIDCLVAQN